MIGAKLGASGVHDQLAVVELDIAATCRREWPTCSRSAAAASLEASTGYEELVIPFIAVGACSRSFVRATHKQNYLMMLYTVQQADS